MDRVPNAQIGEFCGVKKVQDERIGEGVLWYFGHMERNRIAKRVYVGECAGSLSVSRPQMRWTDNVKECLRKRGLNIRQARRMIQDRCEWRGFVRWHVWGVALGMNLWP